MQHYGNSKRIFKERLIREGLRYKLNHRPIFKSSILVHFPMQKPESKKMIQLISHSRCRYDRHCQVVYQAGRKPQFQPFVIIL